MFITKQPLQISSIAIYRMDLKSDSLVKLEKRTAVINTQKWVFLK